MSYGITITETDRNFEVRFPFNRFIVDKLKTIPGARWRPDTKSWIVPLYKRGDLDGFRAYFKLDELQPAQAPEVLGPIEPLPELTQEIPLRMDLFPFQRPGVAYALNRKRLIVGDQPGLGKTAQAIATVVGANAWPVLVICPSSLKLNWQREFEMWTGRRDAIILSDKVRKSWKTFVQAKAARIIIVNYESLKKYFVASIKERAEGAPLRMDHIEFDASIDLFKAVIIDESHRVKEMKTAQTKFTRGITQGKEWVLALTGTPVVNKPRDLISQLSIIGQLSTFGGYKAFADRYCEGYNGASNLKELNYRLNKYCFYRREKRDVLKDLPDKVRQIAMCEITTRKEYADAEEDLAKYLKQYKQATDAQVAKSMRGEIMVQIQALKNISARGKLPDIFEQVADILEQGEKLVLFTHLVEVAKAIKQKFPEALTILGEDSGEERQQAVDRFQNDPSAQLIICSMKVAGVGITLTAGSRVAFCELPWHAADCDQCEDRCHRIGQHDSVQCTYFLGRETIDEHIYKIIQKKRSVADTITGSTESIETELIDLMSRSLFSKSLTNLKTETNESSAF